MDRSKIGACTDWSAADSIVTIAQAVTLRSRRRTADDCSSVTVERLLSLLFGSRLTQSSPRRTGGLARDPDASHRGHPGRPSELPLRHQDMLIQTSQFFRAPDTFDALKEHVYPAL